MLKIFSQEDFALQSKLLPNNFSLHCLIFAGNSRSTGISQLGAGKTGSKRARSHFLPKMRLFPYVYQPFHLLWPITSSLFVFRLGRGLREFFSIFHEVACPHVFFCRPAAVSILMPLTFSIASLNRYAPNFSGVPHKLTWCQQFGLHIFPKWGDAHIRPQKNAVLGVFLD